MPMTFSPGRSTAGTVERLLRHCGRILVAVAAAAPLAAAAQLSESQCPTATHAYGLLDYRTQQGSLATIEKVHFTRRVEDLVSGSTGARPGPDIGYMLHRSPNHHRALLSLSRLAQKLNTDQVPEMRYSVTCYFDRAVRFQPDDTVARLLFARHLGVTGRAETARQQIAVAANHAKDNPLTHYNIGLVAVELKDYARAVEHAHIAYAMGVKAPALRQQLEQAGQWSDPPAKPPATAASASVPAVRASGPR